MEIFRLLLLCTFCFVPTVTFSVEGTNEHISYDIQDPEEPESIPSWKIIQEEDAEEGTVTKCSPPPTSPFGHYEGTTYEMGSTLSLKCDPGYKRTGSEVIRCVPMPYPFRLIVQWEPDNGTMPICRRNNQKDRLLFEEVTGDSDLKCSTPPSQTCGHYEGTNYDIGSKITLICDPGCELVGQSDLHCVGIPNPFRHMVMWDSFTGTMPSCRHIDQRIQRSLNQQEEKKNETPVARTIEMIEKDTTSPPYLESNGTPKSFKDEYGKTTETEHETGKHSVDCSSKAYTGPCRGSFPRFYYDIESDTCQNFTYGGCKGNSNNFKTKEACEKACVKSS